MNTREIPAGSILVGVDGSEPSARAVVWAASQARLEHRQVTLLHAVDMRTHIWVSESGASRDDVIESLKLEAEELLLTARTMLHEQDPGLDVQTVVRFGGPREVLIELSEDAASVVLGSRGRGPIKSRLLGSVGVGVSQGAHCPVVVLRPHEPGGNRIVVGVTGCDPAESAIEFAYRLASLRSAPLVILHSLPDAGSSLREGQISLAGTEDDRILVAETVAGMAEKFPDVDVRFEMRTGPLAVCLVEGSRSAALVVVGAEVAHAGGAMPHRGLSRWVTEHARCAVVVVPEA